MNLEVLYQENLELRAKLKLLTDKPLERKKIVHTKADLIFSDYIRKRANYCCERCGKHYLWGSDLFCIGKEKKIWGEKMRRG